MKFKINIESVHSVTKIDWIIKGDIVRIKRLNGHLGIKLKTFKAKEHIYCIRR